MKKYPPLYELNDYMKSNYFSLRIYDFIKEIDNECNKWFESCFVYDNSYMPSVDIDTSNLLDNLDYIFSEALWIIDVANDLGLDVKDSAKYIKEMYDRYTKDENGYRYFVKNEYYNPHKNCLYTDAEVKQNREDMNTLVDSIVAEMKKEKN